MVQSYISRGRSSVGRAVALQASGRRFDPVRLHHYSGNRKKFDGLREEAVFGVSSFVSLWVCDEVRLFDIVKRGRIRFG